MGLPEVEGIFLYRCPRCHADEVIRIKPGQFVVCGCVETSFVPLAEGAPPVEMVPVLRIPEKKRCRKSKRVH